MSYILEALRKVEQERAIGQVPGIASGNEQLRRARLSRWLWLVIAVLVINAVLLAVALWPRLDNGSATGQVGTAPKATSVPETSAPKIAVSQPVKAAVEPTAKREVKPPVALRPLPPLPEPVTVTNVEPRAVVAPVSAPAPKPVAAVPPNNNLPVWPQVSSQLFQQINSGLHLDVHVYSEFPAQRFVLINMRKYNEGEKLQEGPVVDEITMNDVILSYRGQRFRVQSQ